MPPLKLEAFLLPVMVFLVADAWGVGLGPGAGFLVGLVLGVLAWRRLCRGVRLGFSFLWLSGFVLWVFLSALVQPVAWEVASPLLATGFFVLLLAVIVAHPCGRGWLKAGVVAAGSLAAGWLLIEALFLSGRPSGPFGNPNPAATLVVLALACLRWRRGAGLALHASLLMGGLFASESRAALLALLTLGGIWFFAGSRWRWRWLVGLAVLTGLLGLFSRLQKDRDPMRFERVKIWGVAAAVALDYLPFGTGPGGFYDAALAKNFPRSGEFARYHRVPGLAESDVLQVVASLGLPGFFLALALVVTTVRAWAGRGWLALGPVVALGVTSSVHSQLFFPVLALPALVAGRFSGTLRVKLSPILALLLVWPAAVWAGFNVSHREGPVAKAKRQATDLLKSRAATAEQLAKSLVALSKAASLAPRSAEVLRLLGFVQLAFGQNTGEAQLVEDATRSFRRALELNPNDVWATLGETEAWLILGDASRAQAAARQGVLLEPNCLPCWLALAEAQCALGDLAGARKSWHQAERVKRAARGYPFVTRYEEGLARPEPRRELRLRKLLGGGA